MKFSTGGKAHEPAVLAVQIRCDSEADSIVWMEERLIGVFLMRVCPGDCFQGFFDVKKELVKRRGGDSLQDVTVHEMEQEVFPGTFLSWQENVSDALENKIFSGETVLAAQEEKDRFFMRCALHIAQCGRGGVNPNPLVGAVIVRDGKVIAAGYHAHSGEGHAEVNAFLDARERGVDVRGADMYVTLEPCSHYGKTPPCADRIIKEGIGRVVIAMEDPNPQVAGRGLERIRSAGIEAVSGVMEEEARKLNEVFLKYITKKEPFVFLKMAMSLDGKIATRTGESQWISGETSRKAVHYLRRNYMGIMVGIGTVLADDPMLNCRLEGTNRQPIRIIADTHLRIPLESKIVKTAKEIRTIIAVGESVQFSGNGQETENTRAEQLKAAGAELLFLPEKDGHIDLKTLMKRLGSMGIDGILLEGGSDFAFAALKAGIVDKARIYIAPKLIGGRSAPCCIGGEGFGRLSEAAELAGMKAYSSGKDIFLEGLVKTCLPES